MSFLWFDFETFGTNPVIDRPCQFAAIRTDDNLQIEGEAVSIYCAPADDVLPNPMACLVTGITPQLARREGVIEAEFARRIHELMARPDTCSVGYNNLNFDDEVTRHLFYRNFFDPYEREYDNGNSRWDLINLTRMCYALRPDGIEWPTAEMSQTAGNHAAADEKFGTRPSFRLEDLTRANHIEHGEAHDALADAKATLELAKRISTAQPKLFAWSLRLRSTKFVRDWLARHEVQPIVHTSGRIPSARGCTTLVFPLSWHPDIKQQLIVFDLMADPAPLIELPADDIADLVFTPARDLPEDVERLPLKTIKVNASPTLAPKEVLRNVDQERIGLDLDRCLKHARGVADNLPGIRDKLRVVFHREFDAEERDPDLALYSGGFFDHHDRGLIREIRQATPVELRDRQWSFQDARLAGLLFRYRARNWPESLDQQEWEAWQEDKMSRLTAPSDSGWYGFEAFRLDLEAARREASENPDAHRVLDQVEAWQRGIAAES